MHARSLRRTMMDRVRTICGSCGMGCGIMVWPVETRRIELTGDRLHPASRGRLCPVCEGRGCALGLEGRLLHPELSGRRVGWDRALDHVAGRFADTLARHGPDSIAFGVSARLLTEDVYVANKLMKGFFGAANIDAIASPGLAGIAVAHVRAFGEDVVAAGHEDLEQADLIIRIGCDATDGHIVLHERIGAARAERGTRIAIVGAAGAADEEAADLHLPLRPGSENALMNGLFAFSRRAALFDSNFLDTATETPPGFWDSLEQGHDLWSVARQCDLPPADVQRFYDLFAAHPRTVTMIGPALADADIVRTIINLHLATGRIGKRGAGPFPLTADPNGMGCREVGALPVMLAAHMDFAPMNREAVQRLWGSPAIAAAPGIGAADLPSAIRKGRIKALWLLGDDLVPPHSDLASALRDCPMVITSGSMIDSTTADLAHVRFPAAAWGERDGTSTNSERLVSRERAFLPLPGEARADWWIITQIGRRMGWADAFYYEGPADIYREHCRLSAYRNDGRRLFDLRRHVAISNPAYHAMTPWRWGGDAFTDNRFSTPSGKARLLPPPPPG